MRKCYFCGTLKGLKQIWLEDDIELQTFWQDKKYRACCRQCFKDNELEDWEEHYENWYQTDYNWKEKRSTVVI